ncbi:MAG: hypothetical protein RLW62_02895 [Gammaproteobacteria bacterium]
MTFDTILAAIGGAANATPVAGGNCPGSGFTGCHYESGMALGTLSDITNPIAHLHGIGGVVGYHNDSPGIYLRAVDGSAFALRSLDFRAPINANNPDSGADDVWEILGFDAATDPGLTLGDGTNYATRVAYQTVANGFDGELVLDAAFGKVHAVWIHYRGYPLTPIGKAFDVAVDNVVVAPVAATPVPIPALSLPALGLLYAALVGCARGARRRHR